jgi:Rieske Fe-S protein
MKNVDIKKVVARREVIGAGAIGAAYLLLPEGCGGGSPDNPDAGLADGASNDSGAQDAATLPDATLVEGGGNCKQTDWTRPISIMKAGIALKGTAYGFKDPRFADLYFGGHQILLIHPLTGSGYVAMSGVCTHMGCTPTYFARCLFTNPDGGVPECSVPDGGSDAEDEAGAETDAEEAGSDAEVADAGSEAEGVEAGSDGASDADSGENAKLLTDILFCPCHKSVFNALNGRALSGPAVFTGNLQILDTCVGGGYVFVTIPQNPVAP